MKMRLVVPALGAALVVAACTSIKEADTSRQEAQTKGKYAVRLTEDAEKVQGTCKFIKELDPQYDPIQIPAPSQVPDWLRTEAVLVGADTVLVRQGKFGEAYICGPGPLNPDGTLKGGYAAPVATPAPAAPR